MGYHFLNRLGVTLTLDAVSVWRGCGEAVWGAKKNGKKSMWGIVREAWNLV